MAYCLSSSLLTMALIAGMTAYLIRGKYFDGSLWPHVLMIFAVVLMLQSGWAVAHKLWRLRSGIVKVPGKRTRKTALLSLGPEETKAFLLQKEFAESGATGSGFLIFSKGERMALIAEIIFYTGLVIMLLFGMINYGLSIRADLEFTKGEKWFEIGKSLRVTEKGFWADPSKLGIQMRTPELKPSTAEGPSFLSVEILEGGERIQASLKAGEIISAGPVKIKYSGDYYLAFPTVKRGQHDYLPAAVVLTRKPGDAVYRGTLDMTAAGSRGDVELDPASMRFRMRVATHDSQEIDGTFTFPGEAKKGNLVVGVAALGYFGRMTLWHRNYRDQVVFGMVVLVAGLLLRTFFRPKRVYIRQEEGRMVSFCTNSRALRRELKNI